MSTIPEIKTSAEQKMAACIDAFKTTLSKIRTGRAHTGLLDHIMVDYYGNMTPLNQVANISMVDSRTLGVQVWEKAMAGKVERAIRESELGLNPAAAGDVLRIPMPALTEERRRDLTKVVRSEGENTKIVARNNRRDANEGLKKLLKEKAVSEDDERRAQDDVQKLTDRVINDIDRLVTAKEAEVMAV